jgi:RNA binding exosome subunit
MASDKTAILSAQFSAIAHATEDAQKVEQAMSSLVEAISKGHATFTRQHLKGHHGNVITTISARLSAKDLSPNALALLSGRLSESDRQLLSNDVGRCIDKDGNLYLRFDKQEACLGNVKLYQGDPIRMRLKFASKYSTEEIVDLCRESGLAR